MRRTRILVVDDSSTIRRIVSDAVTASPDLELAATAPHGQAALERLQQTAVDAVTLDVEMPVLDGINTLRALRRTWPRLPVLMFSSRTERGALATLDALAAGASDFVCKPLLGSPGEARAFVDREVLPRLRALTGHGERQTVARPAPPNDVGPAARRALAKAAGPSQRVDAVVVGVSTGGPQALDRVLPRLPRDLPVPVLVVQHMPETFTRLLAARFDEKGPLPVREAADGVRAEPGHVFIAPGGRHLSVVAAAGGPVLRLGDGPPENFCRPAADVLFRSAADTYGTGVLAVVLTGMGRDGCAGAERIRARGGAVLAQDQATSVVWGMPGAVADAGLAEALLPIDDVAPEIAARVAHGRRGESVSP